MIHLEGVDYQNWKDYFRKAFEVSQKYERTEVGIQGNTFYENYIPKDKNNQTIIRIGYLDETLILWKFENPKTIGYSKKQDIEYFYRFDFTPGKSYGGPGLEFIAINLVEINKQLKNGISGKEVQYFKNKKLIKAKIYIDFEGKETKYPNTIYFEKRSFIEKLMLLFTKENNSELTTKEINLLDIFNGIK
jgi:hypothetical protein